VSTDRSLERDIAALATGSLLIGHRLIAPGDENALLAAEAASITSTVVESRRASGAARIVARRLLAQLGYADCPVPKDPSGAPIWPDGIVGSLAHDSEVAVAAVAPKRDIRSVGIDIEPVAPLPPEMLDLIVTPRERERLAGDPLNGKLIFAAKEAVYKAAYRLDETFLEFQDIEVDLHAGNAATTTGRTFALRFRVSTRIVVVAIA
jgi:4'-phosphopantetheinyl transferase EntD